MSELFHTTCRRHGGDAPPGYFECHECRPHRPDPALTPREQRHGCVGNGDASLREHRHGRNFAGFWADACTADEALP